MEAGLIATGNPPRRQKNSADARINSASLVSEKSTLMAMQVRLRFIELGTTPAHLIEGDLNM